MCDSVLSLPTDFPHAHRISDKEVQENGAFTLLPVYRNPAHENVERVALQLSKDWAEIMADNTSNGFNGTENTIFGAWDALILPDGHQERLELTSWFTQFFFLIDDKAEALPRDVVHGKLNVEIANILADSGKTEPTTALAKLLVPQIRKVLGYDNHRGAPYLEALRKWVLEVEARGADQVHDIDDYIELRVVNCGIMPYSYAIEYTMELSLSEAERESVASFRFLSTTVIGLSNDWWTWRKEFAAMVSSSSRLTNAVTILMKQHNLSTHKALALLKQIILDKQQKLIDMRQELLSSGNISDNLRRYIDAHMWMVAGNALWETTCPRYHKELHFMLPM